MGSPFGSPLSRKMNDRFFNSTAVMGNHRSAHRLCSAAPPTNVMNSRRLMGSILKPRTTPYHIR